MDVNSQKDMTTALYGRLITTGTYIPTGEYFKDDFSVNPGLTSFSCQPLKTCLLCGLASGPDDLCTAPTSREQCEDAKLVSQLLGSVCNKGWLA